MTKRANKCLHKDRFQIRVSFANYYEWCRDCGSIRNQYVRYLEDNRHIYKKWAAPRIKNDKKGKS